MGPITGGFGITGILLKAKRAEDVWLPNMPWRHSGGIDPSPRIDTENHAAICESLGWEIGAVWSLDRPAKVLAFC